MMGAMLRKPTDFSKTDEPADPDPVADYMAITNSLLNRLRRQHGWERWDVKTLQEVHSWAGHVARFQAYAPQRWAYQSLYVKGIHYLRALETSDGRPMPPRAFPSMAVGAAVHPALRGQLAGGGSGSRKWADSQAAWLRGRHNWQKQ